MIYSQQPIDDLVALTLAFFHVLTLITTTIPELLQLQLAFTHKFIQISIRVGKTLNLVLKVSDFILKLFIFLLHFIVILTLLLLFSEFCLQLIFLRFQLRDLDLKVFVFEGVTNIFWELIVSLDWDLSKVLCVFFGRVVHIEG